MVHTVEKILVHGWSEWWINMIHTVEKGTGPWMVRMEDQHGSYCGEGTGPWMVRVLDQHGSYWGNGE